MKNRLLIFIGLIAGQLSAGLAQTQISSYRPGATTDGAIYYLPKTALRVSVKVEKTVYQPGDFCRYAQRYLRLNDVQQEPSVSYRVVGIEQEAVPVPDTTKVYALKFNAKSAAANIELSDDGCLLGINAAPQALPSSPEGDTADKFARNAREAPSGAVGGPSGSSSSVRRYLTEEILAAGSTAKMAELTAREIYDLRENRSLLIKGQADFMPKDGEQLRLMLQQLDEQDRALTSLFAGVTTCDTTEHFILVLPETVRERRVLFRLSQIDGLVDPDDLSGSPYYITIDNLNVLPAVDELAAAKTKKKQYEAGVYVNVPGRLRSTIYQAVDPLLSQEFPAPQFGYVELLSADLFNKRYTTHLWVNPLTGAVDKLEAELPKK